MLRAWDHQMDLTMCNATQELAKQEAAASEVLGREGSVAALEATAAEGRAALERQQRQLEEAQVGPGSECFTRHLPRALS